jgi:hypothetical protein
MGLGLSLKVKFLTTSRAVQGSRNFGSVCPGFQVSMRIFSIRGLELGFAVASLACRHERQSGMSLGKEKPASAIRTAAGSVGFVTSPHGDGQQLDRCRDHEMVGREEQYFRVSANFLRFDAGGPPSTAIRHSGSVSRSGKEGLRGGG